ncbi:MAG: translation initiation factor eIF-1A [archaeon]
MNSKNISDSMEQKRLRLPFKGNLEMFGKVIQLMGVNQVKVMCEDGTERNCRIPGKLFKHVWIKPEDIVIVKLWDFQLSKGDVIWRYLGFQKSQLERRGLLNVLYKFTNDSIGYFNEQPENYNRAPIDKPKDSTSEEVVE